MTVRDEVEEIVAGRPARLRGAAAAAGAAGLLLAMATDALSVAGRHFGFTVLGAIEIVQAAIVVAATAAIIVATLDHAHARVRVLLERLGGRTVDALERLADALGALVCLVLAAGSAWLLADLWGGYERTEVLGIPLRWLRLLWVGGSLVCAGWFASFAVRRRP